MEIPNKEKDTENSNKIVTVENKTSAPKDSMPDLIAKELPKDTIPANDPNANKPVVEPSQQPQPQKLASTNIYSIDAGTFYGFGWNYADTLEGRGFVPVIGFGFSHLFNTKWSFSTGFQYGSVGYLNSEKKYSSSTPDFGLTMTDTIIDTRWIHYTVVPLFLHRTLNNNNSIGIGGTIGFMINTTSDYITDSQSDFGSLVQTRTRSSGYMEGLNGMNATLAFSYRRRITNKFSFSAEMHYGITDIKDNAFFAKQKAERSTGIKLTFSYAIFDHK